MASELPKPVAYSLLDDVVDDRYRVQMEWVNLTGDEALMLVKALYRQVDAEIQQRY